MDRVEKGSETLKHVFVSASKSLNLPLWEFIERVFSVVA